jgi:hypothetical protein
MIPNVLCVRIVDLNGVGLFSCLRQKMPENDPSSKLTITRLYSLSEFGTYDWHESRRACEGLSQLLNSIG